MRDLFQVVFELKKKEIEMARQHIQSKAIHDHQPVPLNIKNSSVDVSHVLYSKTNNTENSLSSKYATAKEVGSVPFFTICLFLSRSLIHLFVVCRLPFIRNTHFAFIYIAYYRHL